jgi:hypothetical protein
VESSWFLSAVPYLLVLVGCQAAEPLLDAAGVVPAVDVAKQRGLGSGAGGELDARPVERLGLDGRPQVLRQGVEAPMSSVSEEILGWAV